jgi:protein tyrosine phosphatase
LGERPIPAPKPPTYVNASDIKVAYPRTYLAEEADVDEYVNELRKTLMAQIQQGKKVIV